VDAFRKATRKELEYEKGKPFGALDPEEALHMALQWRFRRDALLLGFASMILVCTTIIIVNRTQACAGGTSTKKSQESQVAPLINQPFNWDLTTNTTSAPQ